MFEPVMELFEKWDKSLIDDLQALEIEVNSVHKRVKIMSPRSFVITSPKKN